MNPVEPHPHDAITGIIAEFSDVFAFSRKRWARYAEEVDAGLSSVGMIILQFIIRKGPVTATGISQLLDMDKSIVSRQLARLRELGFIDTVPAPEDRRVQLVTGSERAVEIIEGIREQWANAYRERFAGWSAEELEALRSGLHRFNASAADPRGDGPAVRCARHAVDQPAVDAPEASDPGPETTTV